MVEIKPIVVLPGLSVLPGIFTQFYTTGVLKKLKNAFLLLSFSLNLLTDGIIFCFGLILSELVVVFQQPVAKVAWIFSILNGVSFLAGIFLSR